MGKKVSHQRSSNAQFNFIQSVGKFTIWTKQRFDRGILRVFDRMWR